jgi:hypothetical protein
MEEYLKKHQNFENEHLKALMREYYPLAQRILREQYKEIYPRSGIFVFLGEAFFLPLSWKPILPITKK